MDTTGDAEGRTFVTHEQYLPHGTFSPLFISVFYLEGFLSEAGKQQGKCVTVFFLFPTNISLDKLLAGRGKNCKSGQNTNPTGRVRWCCEPISAAVYWKHRRWSGHKREAAWLSTRPASVSNAFQGIRKKEGQHGLSKRWTLHLIPVGEQRAQGIWRTW